MSCSDWLAVIFFTMIGAAIGALLALAERRE